MWEPRRLTSLWASTACYKDSFSLCTSPHKFSWRGVLLTKQRGDFSLLYIYLTPPWKRRYGISSQTATASCHIPSNSLYSSNPVCRCIVRGTEASLRNPQVSDSCRLLVSQMGRGIGGRHRRRRRSCRGLFQCTMTARFWKDKIPCESKHLLGYPGSGSRFKSWANQMQSRLLHTLRPGEGRNEEQEGN
jgi:hypothetical protein